MEKWEQGRLAVMSGRIVLTLGWSEAGRGGGWTRRKAVPGELKGQMEVSEGVLHSRLELGGLVHMHGGCTAGSSQAVKEAHQAGEH